MKKVGEQLQLFATGAADPDPWRLHPDDWQANAEAAGHVVAHHSSYSQHLPIKTSNEGRDWGDSTGLHFGTQGAAVSRATSPSGSRIDREFMHTVRIPAGTLGPVMDDDAANFSDTASERVAQGETVPYRNYMEDNGNLSYRTDAYRTWSEDVKDDPASAPALKHLASRGFNMGVNLADEKARSDQKLSAYQAPLWDYETVRRTAARGQEVVGYHGDVHAGQDDVKARNASANTDYDQPGDAVYTLTAAGAVDRDRRRTEERKGRGTLDGDQFKVGLHKMGSRRG